MIGDFFACPSATANPSLAYTPPPGIAEQRKSLRLRSRSARMDFCRLREANPGSLDFIVLHKVFAQVQAAHPPDKAWP